MRSEEEIRKALKVMIENAPTFKAKEIMFARWVLNDKGEK